MRPLNRLVTSACLALAGATAAYADGITLPEGPGRDLVYARCRTCHDLQYVVESKGMPKSSWEDIVVTMYDFGLRIPDAEKKKIAAYLGTYMGPNPPPPPAQPASTDNTHASRLDGQALFNDNCSACHQSDGEGVEGSFPPLAGNTDIFADRLFPIRVVLHGLQGKITVKGAEFDGAMPEFSHLDDGEIAAIINHVRTAWGNADLKPKDMAPLTAEDVKALRGEDMSDTDVHALRAKLLGQ